MTLREFAAAKGFKPSEFVSFGVFAAANKGIVVPYLLADETEHPRLRLRRDDRRFAWSPGDAALVPMWLDRPVPYINGFVWIAEGAE